MHKLGAHIPLTSFTLHKVSEKLCNENTIFLEHTHPLTFWVIKLIWNFQVLQAAIMASHNSLIKEICMHKPVNITKNIMATGSF